MRLIRSVNPWLERRPIRAALALMALVSVLALLGLPRRIARGTGRV